MDTKTCTKCEQTKNISFFYKRKNGNYHSWCKFCNNAQTSKAAKERRKNFVKPSDLKVSVCGTCNKEKNIEQFAVDKSRKNGLHSRCKECQSEYNTHPRRMLSSAKSRAKRFGLDFNLTIEDIVIPEYCPILDIKLCNNKGGAKASSPSLDRIDNSKGYIKGNVAVISYRANSAKRDFSLEDIERLYKYTRKI